MHYLHAPLGEDERALFDALLNALEPVQVGETEILVAALSWPEYVEGVSMLAHKLVDLTACRALVCLVEMDGRVVAVVRSRVPSSSHGRRAGARRRRTPAGGVRDVPRFARRRPGHALGGSRIGGA